VRLDLALVERGLSRSRSHARQLIDSGRVRVGGEPVGKASLAVDGLTPIDVDADRYVSRAAYKLLGALEDSGVAVPGRVLDAGASTGGFTQVCLEAGAQRVYAVDVGHGKIAAALRLDPRVVVWEGVNLRDLTMAHVEDEPVGLVVADVSFISLRLLLPSMLGVLADDGDALLLVKPQFEVGRGGLDGRGVVRDPALRRQAVEAVCADAAGLGWPTVWTGPSRLAGAHGNAEFFVRLGR